MVGVETAGAETVGAGSGAFATVGAGCLRAKKKMAATRMNAAAEARINVVDLDLAGCFGRADRGATLASGAERSEAGTIAACGVGRGRSGEAVTALGETLPGAFFGAATLGARALGAAVLVEVFSGGTTVGGTALVGAVLGGTSLDAIWLAAIWLAAIGLDAIWLPSARGASGALGRGT